MLSHLSRFIVYCAASNLLMASFPTTNEESNIFIAALNDGCMYNIGSSAGENLLSHQCLATLFSPSLEHKLAVELPKRILDWGSNGRAGQPWNFAVEQCDEFFIKLFKEIIDVKTVKLSPHDLFHGHMIEYNQGKTLAILFHAKEYPRDLEVIKNNYQIYSDEFTSNSAVFFERNFIYLSGQIYGIKNQGVCETMFLFGNTASETKIAQLLNGRVMGDINLFTTDTIGRIKYNFYSGYLGSVFYADLEQSHTGQARLNRIIANTIIDETISRYKQNPIIYFLTGLPSF